LFYLCFGSQDYSEQEIKLVACTKVGQERLNKNVVGFVDGGFWLALLAYVLWFLFRAKTVQPLTLDDIALTWKVHKK